MPVFVHLTSHRNVPAIRRGGIALVKRRVRPSGVYAMPVTPNFHVSHQWLRELRRHGAGTVVGVYFRVPDDEPVAIGHYGGAHLAMTAAEAVAVMLGVEGNDPAAARLADRAAGARRARRRSRGPGPLPTSPEGYEVIVPRRIDRAEIVRVKALPQVVGWRYRPGANGTAPCVCLCCERGAFGLRRLVERADRDERAGRAPKVTVLGR